MVANSYVDSEEVDQQLKDDVSRASRSDHHPRRDDDHREEQHYEDHGRCYDDRECHHNDQPEGSRATMPRCRRPENSIDNIEQPHAKRNFNAAYEELLDGPCLIHKNSKHTMRQCHGMAKAFRDEEKKWQTRKDDESDDDKEEERPKDARLAFQDANKMVTTIFGGCIASESKRQ